MTKLTKNEELLNELVYACCGNREKGMPDMMVGRVYMTMSEGVKDPSGKYGYVKSREREIFFF